MVGSGPGQAWAARNQKASRPTSGLHPRAGGRGSKSPTRSRKSEAVVSCTMNTKTATLIHTLKDTHSHAHRHAHICTHTPRAGTGLSVQHRQTGSCTWPGCGRAVAAVWAGLWPGRGGDPPDAVQSAYRQSSWCRNRARGAPRGTRPAGGSAHVGSAGLEGRQHVLELSIQKTDTSQAPST